MPKSIPSRASSSTASLVSRESFSSQKARVTVVFGGTLFPETTKVAVPVTSSTTFAELQFEALRRIPILSAISSLRLGHLTRFSLSTLREMKSGTRPTVTTYVPSKPTKPCLTSRTLVPL
jgi:hypothetical protein